MAPLKDRLSIDWLQGVTPPPASGRSVATAISAQQVLAATVKGALSSQPGQEAKVADLAKSLGVRFSTLLPVVEDMAEQGTLTVKQEDPEGGNHLIKLRGAAF